jgi:hypothetical protein
VAAAVEVESMSSTSLEPRSGGLRRANEVAFQIHARAWFLVNVFLVAVWALTGAGTFWPAWPALGWGLGLALHGAVTYAGAGNRSS